MAKPRPAKRSRIECRKCGKEGHTETDCWVDMTCENCKKKGHPANKCWNEKVIESSKGRVYAQLGFGTYEPALKLRSPELGREP